MPVTLKDIAERAKVTAATVSMVINNKPNISTETREKVLAIARELNYYPNAIARGLATSKANAIGVIVPKAQTEILIIQYSFSIQLARKRQSHNCFNAWRGNEELTERY